MNRSVSSRLKIFLALGSVVSLGGVCVGVAGAQEVSEPQWDFGTCGKMHMIAVNSAQDSVFDRNSDEDAGFFADNITLPVLERVGQPVSGDGSGGITDDRDTDWGVRRGETSWSSSQDWWGESTTSADVPELEEEQQDADFSSRQESDDFSREGGASGQDNDGKWLTRTYINIESVGDEVDIDGAVVAVNEALGKVERSCPDTRVILTGFSEGAQVASMVARQIGSAEGAVAPEKIAGVALFSDPLRDDGQPVVASGADTPEVMPVGALGQESFHDVDVDDIAASMSALATVGPEEGDDVAVSTTSSRHGDEAITSVSVTKSARPSVAHTDASSSVVPHSSVELPAGISSLPRSAPEGYGSGDGGAAGLLPGSFARPQGPVAGGGIAGLTSGVGDFGALAAKTVSWCIDGDLVCGMPEGSATRTIVNAVAPDLDTDNPVASLMAVADTLGPAVVLGGLESVAEDVSFGPGGFQVARATSPDETLIGRIATEAQRADSRSLGEMGARVLAASSKIAGMGLAAGITVARKTLTPGNLAAISAAGTSDPLLGIGVAAAKFAEAALETVSFETATGAAARVFDEVQAAGLNEQAVASVATDAATWERLASTDSYAQVPMTADGRSATDATVDWISALAGGDSTVPATDQMVGFDAGAASDFLTNLRGVAA
ncbi:Cutinase [Corynebacterium oculi]|uniref:Cutinase n=2 Tax=Corynebacterium oculi TaxID=1544416 RepID=A0A0Q0TYB0_9CORY|nr:Cutinase [Corynebacterium oculi]